MTADGKIEYVAPSPYVLKFELSDFFEDLNALLNADLSFEQSLFFASQLHLILVKIHPLKMETDAQRDCLKNGFWLKN